MVYSESDAAKTGDISTFIAWMKTRPDLKNPAYDDLFFVDRDAIPYHDDGRIGTEGELRSKDYHHAIIFNDENTYIAKTEISEKTGKYVLPITRAVKDFNGNVFGYITGLLDMDQIAQEVSSYKVGTDGYFFLTDRANIIIAHNNSQMVSQDISVYHEIAITAKLAKENGDESLYVESNVDGVQCVTFVAPIQSLKCTIGYTCNVTSKDKHIGISHNLIERQLDALELDRSPIVVVVLNVTSYSLVVVCSVRSIRCNGDRSCVGGFVARSETQADV